jgi:uncharacterized membrane protein YphA (DoxX/SURF4 family)
MGLAHEADPVPSHRPTLYSGPAWTLAGRIVFRWAFAYLVLYSLPFPFGPADQLVGNIGEVVTGEERDYSKPSWVAEYVTGPHAKYQDQVVLWVGKEVFEKDIRYRPMGSGDTTWNYVAVFLYAALATAVTLLWTLAAGVRWLVRRRSRAGYPHLHEWLRVYVRFYLAYQMVVYGAMKVIKLQFAYPEPNRVLETYGESSPMRLLWTFMGASDGYTWFTGAGELLAGLLLCTRRTTLLGALVSSGVMVHVAALNFCYDVPVKLFSSHLVLMSLFLTAPDLPWLTRALVLGRPTATPGVAPLVRWRWLDWTLFAVRTLVVVTFVGVTLYKNNESSKLYGRQAPEPPLYGLWEVEEFAVDGQARPPLTTDATRWQRVFFNKGRSFRKSQPGAPTLSAVNMPGRGAFFAEVAVDEEAGTITLTRPGGPPGSGRPPMVDVLTYATPEENEMVVEGAVSLYADGKFGPKQLRVRLRHYGKDRFLLSGRGFHWVNETPYNQYGLRTDPPPEIPPPPKRPE